MILAGEGSVKSNLPNNYNSNSQFSKGLWRFRLINVSSPEVFHNLQHTVGSWHVCIANFPVPLPFCFNNVVYRCQPNRLYDVSSPHPSFLQNVGTEVPGPLILDNSYTWHSDKVELWVFRADNPPTTTTNTTWRKATSNRVSRLWNLSKMLWLRVLNFKIWITLVNFD